MSLTLKLYLLLLLVWSHHVDCASIVKFLPGFEGPLPFELETGYIGIGEEEEVQLFYYFIKSEKNPKEDPLLIWLNGGPGCSSLEGLFFENGPVGLKFEVYNGSLVSLVSSTYSWTQVANIIYLDQPVGAGFSYSRTPLDKTSDTNEAKMIHQFLQKWLSKHPQFLSNSFYVSGDSYSGKTIPALVQEISKGMQLYMILYLYCICFNNIGTMIHAGNYICCKPPINLQGYVLGNPVTHPEIDENYRIPFSHGMSLISDELYEYYLYYLIECWANNERVREALHVEKGTKGHWQRCNWTIPYNQDIISSVPYHMNNSISGYRSLIYSGDHDITMTFQGTQAWIKSLNYSIIDDWRPWMIEAQIAGYTRTYSNKMTYATIKGGGHTAEYKPNETFIMFQRWISGHTL
ncbi:serine carboxypeptidase-like 8 isoform X3 [Brassica rapa]|uniref:serine carboxypeptidase-like 8 isoform X3 n=1 Tax=Brassica campestris TaxID=3711 RepID=UPI00142DAFB6|nr:serine carboxypeptidase-like 8 isoform X3 [Brassica rapa]